MEDTKNKYYTPSVEEFHVGFEYEVEDLHDNLIDRCWRRQVFEGEDATIREWLKTNDVRVKYLDQEDIEELGWKHSGHTTNQWYFIGEEVEYTIVLYKDSLISITDKYPNGITNSDKEPQIIFTGTIKNKSELKRLMKQLSIEI